MIVLKKGVINIVEILILIIIFLGIAALFGSYLLSSTNKQSQALANQQEQVMISLNPPVKVIGIIQVNDVDLDHDGTNDTLPVACVQETSNGMWWLSDTILRAGTLGSTLVDVNTGLVTAELLKDIWSINNLTLSNNFMEKIAEVVYSPLTPKNLKGDNTTNVLLVCRNSTAIINVTSATFYCDQDEIKNVLQDYVNNVCTGTDEKVEVYNLVEFIPPGSTAPVVVHPIYSSSGWNYTSYTISIHFARKIKPDPLDIPLRKYEGENVNSNEVLGILESNGNMTSFIDVFKAECDQCTFYTG